MVIRNHTLTDINVVRIEVIGDVRVSASPSLEGLELALRLAHVAVKVVEVAQCAGLGARIPVRRVEPLVVLDEHEDPLLPGCIYQRQVIDQPLCRRLGDQHVVAALNGVQRDRVVRRIWGEDRDGGSTGQRVDRRLVRVRVGLVVGREGGE